MRTSLRLLFVSSALVCSAVAAPLGSAMKAALPDSTQQIISLDQRKLRNVPSANELRGKFLPAELADFGADLRRAGIDWEKDFDQVVFATYRDSKGDLRLIGMGQGGFSALAWQKKHKMPGSMYRKTRVFDLPTAMRIAFLDDSTILFGDLAAVHEALDTSNGMVPRYLSRAGVEDLMSPVQNSAAWSVMDASATQFMLKNMLGDAARLADYTSVRSLLQGTRYSVDTDQAQGMNVSLDVLTSSYMPALTLTSVVRAAISYKRLKASDRDKALLDRVVVDADGSRMRLRLNADGKTAHEMVTSGLFSSLLQ